MYSKLERIGDTLLDPNGQSRVAPAVVAFFALSALVLGGAMLLGPYPITLFPEDAAHLLVQGDYLVRGYRPYVDYFSMHGPFPFLFVALGIKANGISLWATLLAQVVGAAVFGCLMFKVAISRLHAFWAVLLGISVELILISCTPMGKKSWREFCPAMWYNAMSFSIVAIVYVYLLAPSRSRRAASQWVDAAIAGFCLMACFHAKISFFAPLAMVFGIGAILLPRNASMRLQGLFALALAGAGIVGLMTALGGSLTGYKAFLGSLSIDIHPLSLSLRFIQYTRTIGVFLIGMLLAGWMAEEAGVVKNLRREWLLSLLMFGALLLMVSTCKQDPETLPLIGVIPLCVTVLVGAEAKREGRPISLSLATMSLAVALLLVSNEAKNGALSWVFSRMTIKTVEAPVEHDPGAVARAEQLVTADRVDPNLYALMPSDWVATNLAALELLKNAHTEPGQVLYVATTADSVTLMTNLKYARGQSPWAPYQFAPSPEDAPLSNLHLLEDADWVLRNLDEDAGWRYLTHYRREYFDSHFTEESRNDHWALYRRISGEPTATPTPQ